MWMTHPTIPGSLVPVAAATFTAVWQPAGWLSAPEPTGPAGAADDRLQLTKGELDAALVLERAAVAAQIAAIPGGGGGGSLDLSAGSATRVVLDGAYRPRTSALDVLRAGLAARLTMPAHLVFVGSSTIKGNNASHTKRRFVDRVVAALQTAFPSSAGAESTVQNSGSATWATASGPGVHGYNAGEGGAVASTYLTPDECTRVAATNPRAVFHMIGSNDFQTSVSPATYKANLQAVITDLKSKITVPCVHVLLNTFERIDAGTRTYPWSAYGAAMAEIAAADPANVAVIDVAPAFARVGVPGSDPLDLVDTDGIHPTNAGHELITAVVLDAMGISRGAGQTGVIGLSGDDFARVDGPLAGSKLTTGDGVWSAPAILQSGAAAPATGLWQVVGGQAKRLSGSSATTERGLVIWDSGCTRGRTRARVAIRPTSPADASGGLVFASNAAGTAFAFLSLRTSSSTYQLAPYEVTADGGAVVRITGGSTAHVAVQGDVVEVEENADGTVTVWVNSVLQYTSTGTLSSAVRGGTYRGLLGAGAWLHEWDDIVATPRA